MSLFENSTSAVSVDEGPAVNWAEEETVPESKQCETDVPRHCDGHDEDKCESGESEEDVPMYDQARDGDEERD